MLPGRFKPEEPTTATPVLLLDDSTVLVTIEGAVTTADVVSVDIGSTVDAATVVVDVVGTADDVIVDSGGAVDAATVAAVDAGFAVVAVDALPGSWSVAGVVAANGRAVDGAATGTGSARPDGQISAPGERGAKAKNSRPVASLLDTKSTTALPITAGVVVVTVAVAMSVRCARFFISDFILVVRT